MQDIEDDKCEKCGKENVELEHTNDGKEPMLWLCEPCLTDYYKGNKE